jgi:vacuolar-type H+-ATPase subunit D/Vma8
MEKLSLDLLVAMAAQTIAVGAFLGATNSNVRRLLKDVENINAALAKMHSIQSTVDVLVATIQDLRRRIEKLEK